MREQILLPLRMVHDQVNVAHFPCNSAPILSPFQMVVTIHDTIPLHQSNNGGSSKHRLMNEYWRFVLPRCARHARLVATVSQHSAADLQTDLGLAAQRIRVVYNSIDDTFRNGGRMSSRTVWTPTHAFCWLSHPRTAGRTRPECWRRTTACKATSTISGW